MGFENGVNLWLDDRVPPPTPHWIWIKTVKEVKVFLTEQKVHMISLDHDLGENQEPGYDLVKWMMVNKLWSRAKPQVHSMNPVGGANMKALIDKYWEPYRST
jgi:hypothetical protein